MKLFTFNYEIISENKKDTWSFKALDEETARIKIQERIADFEMVELNDVVVGELAKEPVDAKDVYYECEGCT